jgi:hypothetical protein
MDRIYIPKRLKVIGGDLWAWCYILWITTNSPNRSSAKDLSNTGVPDMQGTQPYCVATRVKHEQPVRLRLSANQPIVFFSQKKPTTILLASQISPSEQAGTCRAALTMRQWRVKDSCHDRFASHSAAPSLDHGVPRRPGSPCKGPRPMCTGCPS